MPHTIMEPFRIKVTEPLKIISREKREKALRKAHNNVFLLPSPDVSVDLLTDSGTGAMSTKQWAAMMLGDESYAGSPSFRRFERTIRRITGMKHIFPTHQGRAAEGILALTRTKPGDVVPNNSHFDTTRANFEFAGVKALDLICEEGLQNDLVAPFKGNMHLEKLESVIKKYGRERIPFAMITVTNNTSGGQPVSMANIRATKALLQKYDIPLVMDACRFAENAYFIQQREEGYQDKSLYAIAKEMFSCVDAATMSLKKDGLVNIGGFLVCQDDTWAEDFQNALILREGFITYGGLAGRDLEAAAVGLMEALDPEYQTYRHATVSYLARAMEQRNIPYVKPAGGHAVFIDAKAFLPHIPPLEYPGIALVNALYLDGGIRSVELGSVMFGHFDEQGREQPSTLELVRLAIPRRVYTQSHFDYIIEILDTLLQERDRLKGYRITYQPKLLRHFTCHFETL
ncbi:MAG: tryptophanase [Calditrichaeota bacterium]|nr:MAG: tryptophanase [Calditrichota bacterium]